MLEIGDGVFEVKSTNGDTHLGGEDFDLRIIDFLADEFKKDQGIDLRSDKMALAAPQGGGGKGQDGAFLLHGDRYQPALYHRRPDGPKHLNIKLSRAKLEALVDDLLHRLEGPCRTAMKDAGLSAAISTKWSWWAA
jgi:molecular chaperone DnaK